MVYWIEIYCSTPVNIPPLWRAQLALAQSTVCIQYYTDEPCRLSGFPGRKLSLVWIEPRLILWRCWGGGRMCRVVYLGVSSALEVFGVAVKIWRPAYGSRLGVMSGC